MRGRNARANAATTAPIGCDLKPAWVHARHKVVANLVRHGLVENAFVSERVQVQLQALELDAGGIGFKCNRHRAKVGVPRFRTDRRELFSDVLNEKRRLRW